MTDKPTRPKQKSKSSVKNDPGSRKTSDLSPAEFKKLFSFFGSLLTDLKKNWELRPENLGKTVKYSELWAEYVATTNKGQRYEIKNNEMAKDAKRATPGGRRRRRP